VLFHLFKMDVQVFKWLGLQVRKYLSSSWFCGSNSKETQEESQPMVGKGTRASVLC